MAKGDEEAVRMELAALYNDSSDVEPDLPLRRWILEECEVCLESD